MLHVISVCNTGFHHNANQSHYIRQYSNPKSLTDNLWKIFILFGAIQCASIFYKVYHDTNHYNHFTASYIIDMILSHKILLCIIICGLMSWISIQTMIASMFVILIYYAISSFISILPFVLILGALALSYFLPSEVNYLLLIFSGVILVYFLLSTISSALFIPKYIFMCVMKLLLGITVCSVSCITKAICCLY